MKWRPCLRTTPQQFVQLLPIVALPSSVIKSQLLLLLPPYVCIIFFTCIYSVKCIRMYSVRFKKLNICNFPYALQPIPLDVWFSSFRDWLEMFGKQKGSKLAPPGRGGDDGSHFFLLRFVTFCNVLLYHEKS